MVQDLETLQWKTNIGNQCCLCIVGLYRDGIIIIGYLSTNCNEFVHDESRIANITLDVCNYSTSVVYYFLCR